MHSLGFCDADCHGRKMKKFFTEGNEANEGGADGLAGNIERGSGVLLIL
jgi:hypothetical protein